MTPSVWAQQTSSLPFKDSAEIIFGQGGSAPDPTGEPGGGEDGLGPGEFIPPFKCGLKYWSWTYPGHSKYSIDINRGNGDDDRGDPVLASADGTVHDVYLPKGAVVIRHEGKYYTSYFHMQNIIVTQGQSVKLGQKIGEISDTGSPGQYHLHVNHSKNGSPYIDSNRIQVCYKGFGCNQASVAVNDSYRYGDDYLNQCP